MNEVDKRIPQESSHKNIILKTNLSRRQKLSHQKITQTKSRQNI